MLEQIINKQATNQIFRRDMAKQGSSAKEKSDIPPQDYGDPKHQAYHLTHQLAPEHSGSLTSCR